MKISPNATVVDTKTNKKKKKKTTYLQKASSTQRYPTRNTLTSPLPTLKWGLGRGGSWLYPFWSLRYITCTWAPLDWPCLPTRCSITGSKPWLSIFTTHQNVIFLLQCILRPILISFLQISWKPHCRIYLFVCLFVCFSFPASANNGLPEEVALKFLLNKERKKMEK